MADIDKLVLTDFKSEVSQDADLLAQAVLLEAQNIRLRQTLAVIFQTLTKDDQGNFVVRLEDNADDGTPHYLNVFVFMSHLMDMKMPKRTTLEIVQAVQRQCVQDFMNAVAARLNDHISGSVAFRHGYKMALNWLLKAFRELGNPETPPAS